jgi:hypothetical protein
MKDIGDKFGVLILIVLITLISCKKVMRQPIELSNEVARSNAIIPLGGSWEGTMAGLIQVSVSFDTATESVCGTIRNISSQKLCWALFGSHLKPGDKTDGKQEPQKLGGLNPDEQVITHLSVQNDPNQWISIYWICASYGGL